MRSAFPPDQNISQRFSNTQTIRLQRADVVSQDQAQATLGVLPSDLQAKALRCARNQGNFLCHAG